MTTIPITLYPREARAVRDGRLGLIIRPVEPQPWYRPFQIQGDQTERWYNENRNKTARRPELLSKVWECPFGKPGDRLWGREWWRLDGNGKDEPGPVYQVYASYMVGGDAEIRHIDDEVYKASNQWIEEHQTDDWQPPSTMPTWACRAHLVNRSVRVGRVQDVTEVEAKLTGVESEFEAGVEDIRSKVWRPQSTHVLGLKHFWNRHYAKRGLDWEQDPWCWFVGVGRRETIPTQAKGESSER